MRTDHHEDRGLIALLGPLRLLCGYAERITERADAEARAAGLTVEKVGRWRRCYSHAGSAANGEPTPTDAVGKLISTTWSTPTLTTSDNAVDAGAGWAR